MLHSDELRQLNWSLCAQATLFDEPLKRGVVVRDALLEFHKEWYSANAMGLGVLGKGEVRGGGGGGRSQQSAETAFSHIYYWTSAQEIRYPAINCF